LTITSYSNNHALSEYKSDIDNSVQVNVYEKECCYGHSDTGPTSVYPPAYDDVETMGFCKYNDLTYNGDFSDIGTGDPLEPWNSTGSISVKNGYAFINGAASLSQQLYDPTAPDIKYSLETGKKFNLVFRYYGASTSSGVTKTMSYTLSAVIGGGTRYWNASTKTFGGSVSNEITLRPFTQRLGISSYSDDQKDMIKYFKFDEYITTIDLRYGGSTGNVGNINLAIVTPSGSEVVFNYISCIMHNQFERFGGFPGTPTSRFWYF
jgi:hypothetical protein